MIPPIYKLQSNPRIRAFYFTALAVILCSSSSGQELSPPKMAPDIGPQEPIQSEHIQANGIQESSLSGNAKEDTSGNVLAWGPVDVQLSSKGSVVYNDNIYIQQTNKTSDLIWTLSPDIKLDAGDYLQKEESWLTVDYSPSFILFTEHGGNDAIDQDGRLNFELHPASWTFGLNQGYQKLSGAVVEAGGRENRSIYNTFLYIKYDLSPKTTFELDGTQSVNDYDLPLFSYNTWTVDGWVDYWVTPKIKLGVGATGGFLDVTQNPNQTYQQGLLRVEYDMSEEFALRGSVGGELREFQSGQGNKFNGIFSLGGTYTPWENTKLLFDAYRRDASSLVEANQNYTITGGSVGISQIICDKYTLNVTGGLNYSDYYATSQGVNAGSSYTYFFVRPGIDYQITDQLTAGIFYQYQQSSSSGVNAFAGNQTGFNVIYHF